MRLRRAPLVAAGTAVALTRRGLNGDGAVLMSKRHKWMVMAGIASAIAAPLAERAVAAAWRSAAGEDPPIDVDGRDVDWGRALAWTAASAVVVAIAQVVARRGAGVVWQQLTGARPPLPRQRRKRLARA